MVALMNPMTSAAISAAATPLTEIPVPPARQSIPPARSESSSKVTAYESPRMSEDYRRPARNLSIPISRERESCYTAEFDSCPRVTPRQKINCTFAARARPCGTLRNSTSRRISHARPRTQRIRIQEATARRTAQDGLVPERPQPDRGRTTRAQRLRLAAGRHAARPHGLRKTFRHAERHLRTVAPNRWSASADTTTAPASSRRSTWAPTASSFPTSTPPKKRARPSVARSIPRSARARSTSRSAA